MIRTKNYSTSLTKYFILTVVINILLAACSQSYGTNSKTMDTSDPKKSDYYLLDYAEQYRDISSIMNRRQLEQDYVSLGNLYSEASRISQSLVNFEVTSEYKIAKDYLVNWMWNDLYFYKLIMEDGSKEFINISSENSIEYLTLFLEEMIRFGHDLD